MVPRVSICIPAYEYAKGLQRALESVFTQDLDDFEVIITDDSRDDSIADAVNSTYKDRVIYAKNPVILGSPENWNESVRMAKGEYIKILHHDDWFTYPDSLRQYVEMLDSDPSVDLAFSGSMQVNAGISKSRAITVGQAEAIKADPDTLFTGNHIGSPSAVMFRRARMQEFDKKLKWLVDVELYIRMLRANGKFVYTEKPLVSIGVGPSQITNACVSDRELNMREYSYVYEKLALSKNQACRRHMEKVLSAKDPLPLRMLKKLIHGAFR